MSIMSGERAFDGYLTQRGLAGLILPFVQPHRKLFRAAESTDSVSWEETSKVEDLDAV